MRKLTENEIAVLTQQGCMADDWNCVRVAETFNPCFVRSSRFSGNVELGEFSASFAMPDGFSQHSGVENATLHNCKVGNNCYVGNIGERIANYVIGDGAYVCNIGLLTVVGECSFGNGTQVAAINEGGGREITITDQTPTPVAFFVSAYRNRKAEVQHLEALAQSYAESQKSAMGVIGAGASITNCTTVRGVRVGEYARLNGCSWLENGTVDSSRVSPSEVGADVVARDFIFCKATEVGAGAQLLRCYVGEGSQVGEQFAATDCFISCNCQFFHGEGASVFAGPYSVSHHKATLLIAASISFFNAGSGSNQSNHAYKLGPNHQGILDRGSKLASSSYLLWPAHLGAFTTVLGCHKEHPDTTELPFSYLLEKQGEAYLLPAANLRSVGTMRDADKWPKRDKRGSDCTLDVVSLDMLNPFTIAQIQKGIAILERVVAGCEDVVTYKGLKIKQTAAVKGLELYRLAVDKYKGDVLLKVGRMAATQIVPVGDWCDLGGCVLPVKTVGLLEKANTFADIRKVFADAKNSYTHNEWMWLLEQFPELADVKHQDEAIAQWQRATERLAGLALDDAKKEFSDAVMLGYGLDGGHRVDDFAELRGEMDDNSFVRFLYHQIEDSKKILADWGN